MKVEELDVFKLAHELVLKTYKITANLSREEKCGLVSQMRRVSSSVPTNLMEGGHRFSKNEYKHFVSISKGSTGEMKYHLYLSKDLGYLEEKTYLEIRESYERVSMMLTKLYDSI